MNSDNLPQMLQTGFHLTLGATSFLIETLQDPLKREENLGKLKSDLGLLADELLEKGEMTDREARNFVDTIFAKPGDRENTDSESVSPNQSDSPADNSPESVAQPDVQLKEIQELTAQMAALRAELENLRAEDSQP
jgi:polyhydroxyalkanoate synthesis regulator phasin